MYLVRPVRAQRERGGGADSKNLANHKKKIKSIRVTRNRKRYKKKKAVSLP